MKLMDVRDQSQVAAARREIAAAGRAIGMSEHSLGRAAIVVTEMATNQLKHAGGGRIACASYEDHTGSGLELVAFDSGPGIADLAAAMRDGHSTAGSPGQGLGAIKRQADVSDLVSWPGRGTAILARIAHRKLNGTSQAQHSSWGAISAPAPREEVCGDSWLALEGPEGLLGMVVDGLGHGPGAATAAMEAARIAGQHADLPPASLLERINAALRATRGAAVALFRADGARISYAGIGNISGTAFAAGRTSRMVSMNGTAGIGTPRLRAFEYEARPGTLVILHSDGIGTGWSLDNYPGLAEAHPTLIATVLLRDHSRGRDDATVLVTRVGAA